MATMTVACQCGRALRVKTELAGRRGRCPGCGQPIEFPSAPIAPPVASASSPGPNLSETEVARSTTYGSRVETESEQQAIEEREIELANKLIRNQTLAFVSLVVSALALILALYRTGPRSTKQNGFDDGYIIALANRVGRIEYGQSLQGYSREAILDPASKNYSRVDSQIGFFLVSCQNVQPFLDGYKVTLHVGNPQNTDYSGFVIKAKWGQKYKGEWSDQPAVTNWLLSSKSQEFSFTNTLFGGRWNQAEITLRETSAEQLGMLQVSIDVNVASFGVPLTKSSP